MTRSNDWCNRGRFLDIEAEEWCCSKRGSGQRTVEALVNEINGMRLSLAHPLERGDCKKSRIGIATCLPLLCGSDPPQLSPAGEEPQGVVQVAAQAPESHQTGSVVFPAQAWLLLASTMLG